MSTSKNNMFITDIPQSDLNITPSVSMEMVNLGRGLLHKPNAVYTICDFPGIDRLANSTYSIYGTTKGGFNEFNDYGSLDLITISNIFFEGSRPLRGQEAALLNKAFLKSQSSTPTKL